MAKMTLKKALERANAFPKEKDDEILSTIKYAAKDEDIVFYPHIKDGCEAYECCCPKCGTLWTVKDDGKVPRYMVRSSFVCPECGHKGDAKQYSNSSMASVFNPRDQETYFAVLDVDMENGFLLLEEVKPSFRYSSDVSLTFDQMADYADREDYSFLKGKWVLCLESRKRIVFLADKGFRSVTEQGKSLSKANSSYDEFRREFNGGILLDANLDNLIEFAGNVTGTECTKENVLKQLSDYSYGICRESSQKSRRGATKLEEMLQAYEPEKVPDAEFDNAQKLCGNSPSVVTDTFARRKRSMVYCMSCGTMYTVDLTEEGYTYRTNVKCPHCGAEANIRMRGREDVDFIFFNGEDPFL